MHRVVGSLAAVVLAACAQDARDPARCRASGLYVEEDYVRRAQPAPGGVGWCCPGEPAVFASEGGHTGGFADDPCACGQRHVADAPACAYHRTVDSFGCEAYGISFGPGCGVLPDAGPARDDAGTEDGGRSDAR